MNLPASPKSILVLILSLGLGAVAADVFVRQWGSGNSATDNRRVLDIRPADLDLGQVWLQKEQPFAVQVRNVSDRPVVVTQFAASCNCTTLSPSAFNLPPNGRQVVRGVIDLTRSVHESADGTFPFDVTLSADIQAAGSKYQE